MVEAIAELKSEKDKEWLDAFIKDKLQKSIHKVEQEVDNIRNKKVRGAIKKQKDMLKQLNDKLKLMRGTRIKCEELAMTMSFLEGGAIKTLKGHLRKYYEDHDNESLREAVDKDIDNLLALADLQRREEDLINQVGGIENKNEEEKKQMDEASDTKYGHLSWLNKMIDLGSPSNSDICFAKKISNLGMLKEGMILDA